MYRGGQFSPIRQVLRETGWNPFVVRGYEEICVIGTRRYKGSRWKRFTAQGSRIPKDTRKMMFLLAPGAYIMPIFTFTLYMTASLSTANLSSVNGDSLGCSIRCSRGVLACPRGVVTWPKCSRGQPYSSWPDFLDCFIIRFPIMYA